MNVHDDTHIFDQVFRVWVRQTSKKCETVLSAVFYFHSLELCDIRTVWRFL